MQTGSGKTRTSGGQTKHKRKERAPVFRTLPGLYGNCKGHHSIESCFKFRDMSVEKRAENVKFKKLCLRCLGTGHLSSARESKKSCNQSGCKAKHHTLMHGASFLFPKTPGSSAPPKPPPPTQAPDSAPPTSFVFQFRSLTPRITTKRYCRFSQLRYMLTVRQ